MYTDIETLPTEVKATLDPEAQVRWMAHYNSAITKDARGNHRLAMLNAWTSVTDSPYCRLFGAFVSSDRLDKQNDTVDINKTYAKILKCIERGGTITDTHSNRVIGSFIYADLRKTHTGHNGVYAFGVIEHGEPYHDTVWQAIKKAVSCPTCRDNRRGTSIGGFALDTDVSCSNGQCHRVINDLSIHEISVCHEPANDDAIIDYVNMLAKSESVLSDISEDGVMINKAMSIDPRANEAVPEKSPDEMAAQAQNEAAQVQGAQEQAAPAMPQQTLGDAVTAAANGGNDGSLPTLDEIKNFKMKVGNTKKYFKEFASIIEMVNQMGLGSTNAQQQPQQVAQPQPQAQPQAQPQEQPEETQAQEPTEDAPVQKDMTGSIGSVGNGIKTGFDAIGTGLDMAASGDIAGFAGVPGAIAGKLSGMATPQMGSAQKINNPVNTAQSPDATQANQAAAQQSGETGEVMSNTPSAVPLGDTQAPKANEVPLDNPVGKASCGCMDKEVHTPITAKKCPMPKELYGDEEDASKREYLENKDYDESVDDLKSSKKKGDEGMVDAANIKGEKTADEGPSVKSKEEAKLPEKVLGKSLTVETAEQLISVLKAYIKDSHIAEDMKKEDFIENGAEEIADAVKDMKQEDKTVEKCSMTQEQFKAKYDPKKETSDVVEKAEGHGMTQKEFENKYAPSPEKASQQDSNPNKQLGKEGKKVFMKSDENSEEHEESESPAQESAEHEAPATDDSTLADGNVGQQNSQALVQGAEQIAQGGAQSQELSAQQLIQMVVQFLESQGVQIQNPPLQNPQIEAPIQKDPLGVTEFEMEGAEVAKAVMEGNLAMNKMRMRTLESRLKTSEFNAMGMINSK